MNDYQMSSLAADRTNGFHAEADRARLAATAKARRQPAKAELSRQPRRFSLGWLLRRAVA